MSTVRRPLARFASLVGLASILFCLPGCDRSFQLLRTHLGVKSDVQPSAPSVRVDPDLYPAFRLSVVDYVNRCDPDVPTEVTVRAPAGTTVSVAGRAPRSGTFTTEVSQQVNERFRIVVSRGGTTTTHHVRCLPLDFPEWSATRHGTPRARYFATTIIEGEFEPSVPVIFDTNGVPVWWTERQPSVFLAPLPNGNLAHLNYLGGMVVRRLDGRPTRVLNTRGAPSDFHDVVLLPNRHVVLATNDVRPCDLSAWGRGRDTCAFHEFQELTPRGKVVWRWRPEDDIGIRQTVRKWRNERQGGVADPWHYNSNEWTGDGFLISFRHMDAVFKIDYASKDVVWKLGGKHRPRSLRVLGDPVFRAGGSISGQHDVRLLRRGLVTLFDNGTRANRAPRSVVYRIDERARTATMVRQVRDRIARRSRCCGSTRVLSGGHHVTGWGGTPWITENRRDGTQVFRLNVGFVYRATPIADGRYTRRELRAAMDAQYRNGVFAHPTTASVSNAGADRLTDVAARARILGSELDD